MLRALKDFFDRNIAPAPERDERRAIELATAALLVETLRIDAEILEPERAAALAAVRATFGLSEAEAGELLALAEQEIAQANDYFQFTSLINRHFTPERKLRVVEAMYRVAWSDAEFGPHERHLMRRIVDLLHVPHGDAMAAQARARGGATG
ncbi:MAG TPA: TerB family tellurite resistance protein [Burkholderiaceae bacterium]|nr:TerB family tellurite resistance protein [Burkholderiaceae bacterium]